jgi:hypothetical protein
VRDSIIGVRRVGMGRKKNGSQGHSHLCAGNSGILCGSRLGRHCGKSAHFLNMGLDWSGSINHIGFYDHHSPVPVIRRIGKHKPLPDWARELQRQVVERDEGLCVLCGAPAVDIQHIIPRARGKVYSRKIWRMENMACTCRACHKHDSKTRLEFIAKMAEQYDMSWVKDFGIAFEGGDGEDL